MITDGKNLKGQSGVALLLSLGFAGLLLVLVLAFATNAILENKVAVSNSARAENNIVGDIALSRAMTALRYYVRGLKAAGKVDAGLFRFDNVVSRSGNEEYSDSAESFVGMKDCFSSVSIGGKDFSALRVAGDIVYLYPNSDTDNAFDPSNSDCLASASGRPLKMQQPQWQYLHAGVAGSETDPLRVIGRFAYAVLPDMGSVHKTVFQNYPTSSNVPVDPVSRYGASFNDFPLSALGRYMVKGDGSGTTYGLGPVIAKVNDATGKSDPHIRQVLEGLIGTDSGRSKSIAPMLLYRIFNPLWYIDSSLCSPYSKKFLDRVDSTLKDLCLLQQSSIVDGTTTIQRISSVISRLPHLSRLDSAAVTDAASKTAMRKQVAANLIDYFDADDVPSSDIDATEWAPDSGPWTLHPSFTGNERTPYINEVAVNLVTQWRAGIASETIPSGNSTIQYEWWDDIDCIAQLHVAGEIANLFPLEHNKNYKLRIYVSGDVYVRCWLYLKNSKYLQDHPGWSGMGADGYGHFAAAPLSLDSQKYIEIPIEIKQAGGPHAKRTGYFTGVASLNKVEFARDSSVTNPRSLKEYKRTDGDHKFKCLMGMKDVVVGPMVLIDADTNSNIDYVKPFDKLTCYNYETAYSNWNDNNVPSDVPERTSAATFADTQRCATFAYSAKDPRANLNRDDWAVQTPNYKTDSSIFMTDFTPATLGTYNANAISYTADFAGKDGTDPLLNAATLLSPYSIRNGSMTTAGELTLLSRGVPGETLNLLKAAAPGATSISYSDGDAGILDQVKMADLSTKEKIDMNTRSEMIWSMIFTGVNYSEVQLTEENTLSETAGNVISFDDAKKLAQGMRKSIRSNKINFKSPAELLKEITLADGVTKKTVLQSAVDEAKTSFGLTGDVANMTPVQQEALVARIVPLLKTAEYPDSFYILVLAQGIKDVGGIGNTVSVARTYPDGSVSSKNCELGKFDFDYNGGNVVYYDSITSNIRLLAKVRRWEETPGESKFEIINVEYLTE